jgi:hypothetical protein
MSLRYENIFHSLLHYGRNSKLKIFDKLSDFVNSLRSDTTKFTKLLKYLFAKNF